MIHYLYIYTISPENHCDLFREPVVFNSSLKVKITPVFVARSRNAIDAKSKVRLCRKPNLGGGFNYFACSPLFSENDPI